MDFDPLNPQSFGPRRFLSPDEIRQQMMMQAAMQQQQQQAQGGGGFGIVGDIVGGIVRPFAKFANQGVKQVGQIADTGRMLTAQATGNTEAWRNANEAAKRRNTSFGDQGGIFNMGTITNADETARGDFATGARKIGGTTAMIGATIAPVGKAATIAGKAAQAAAAGGIYGAGEASNRSGKLEDVLTGAAQGGLVGGAFGGAFGLGGKALSSIGGSTAGSAAERSRRALLGNAWGIKSGTKVNGDFLTPQNATKLQNFVVKEMQVPKTANASMVFERAVNFADDTGNAISSAIKAADRPLTRSEVSGLAKSMQDRFSKVAGVDYTTNSGATQLLKQAKSVKTVDDLWQLRKAIDDRINFNRNSQTPDTVFEQFARNARQEVSDRLSSYAPQIKPLNQSYGQVQEVLDLVAPAARSPRGINILNNRIGGAVVQRGQSVLGQTGGFARGVAGKLPSLPQGSGQAAARAATIGTINNQPSLESELLDQSSLGMSSNMPNTTSATMSQNMDQSYQQQSQSSNPYSRENLMADIQRDPQNADQYIKYYSMLEEVYNPTQTQPEMSQSSRNAMASSDNAINTVNQLEQLFAGAGGGSGRIGGLLKGVAADVGLDEGAKVYDSLANASVTQIAKALAGSGAGTVSDMDARVIMAALPTLRDNPNEARAKFLALRQRLENARNNTMMYGGGGGSSLEDALLQQQGAF